MTTWSDADLQWALERQHLFPFVWSGFDLLHPDTSFRPAWHVEAICHALERVASGECRRLLITVPPRHGKSICTAVCFPAWMLGREPSLKVMVASYGGDLANKHAADFRKVVAAPWYQLGFPAMRLAAGGNRADEQLTTRGGGRKAISLGGAATGFGADIIIIDDLMKAGDANSASERQRVKDFYEQTLLSRLNNQEQGRIVVVQQRLHEDDLPGYLIEKGIYEHLNLPAIAIGPEKTPIGFGLVRRRVKNEALCPEHLSAAELERLRIDMSNAAFSAQYQQDPTPPGGNRILWKWFGTYESAPARHELQYVIQSWDTALMISPRHDYSVGMTWGLHDNDWLLLDVVRERLEFPALKSRVMATARRWRPDAVVIEQAASGISLLQQLRIEDKQAWKYSPHRPKQDKEIRLEAMTAHLDGGRYFLPAQAPWLADLRREWITFPGSTHDDQVDSLVQFLEFIHERRWQAHMNRDPVSGRPYGGRRPYKTWRTDDA